MVEERARTNVFSGEKRGIAEGQKVGEGGPGRGRSWEGSEAQGPKGRAPCLEDKCVGLESWPKSGGCYRSLAVRRSFEEKGMTHSIIY